MSNTERIYNRLSTSCINEVAYRREYDREYDALMLRHTPPEQRKHAAERLLLLLKVRYASFRIRAMPTYDLIKSFQLLQPFIHEELVNTERPLDLSSFGKTEHEEIPEILDQILDDNIPSQEEEDSYAEAESRKETRDLSESITQMSEIDVGGVEGEQGKGLQSKKSTNVPVDVLSPHEYLDHLQREQYGSALSPFSVDVGDVLTANLIGALPAEHRRQLERVAIGVLPSPSVNAWVMRVPSGGEVIGFYFGTMSFMLMLNKILLSRVSLFGFEPILDFKVAAALASDTVKHFFDNKEIPRVAIPPRRMLIASSLSNIQTAFIVGHEIGHVLLGHLRSYTNNGQVEHSHDQEFAADARGGELALTSFSRSYDPLFGVADMSLAQAAIDLFFTYLIFMEDVIESPELILSPSHPTSKDRRTELRRRFWTELPENARMLAQAGEKTFDGFRQVLDNG